MMMYSQYKAYVTCQEECAGMDYKTTQVDKKVFHTFEAVNKFRKSFEEDSKYEVRIHHTSITLHDDGSITKRRR